MTAPALFFARLTGRAFAGRQWITLPMNGKAAERRERMGLPPAWQSHAVNLLTDRPLCRVNADSLCQDSSLATADPPDCPVCRGKIARMEAAATR